MWVHARIMNMNGLRSSVDVYRCGQERNDHMPTVWRSIHCAGEIKCFTLKMRVEVEKTFRCGWKQIESTRIVF